jgi:hypothetical protein
MPHLPKLPCAFPAKIRRRPMTTEDHGEQFAFIVTATAATAGAPPVASLGVVTATGVSAEARREILGCAVGTPIGRLEEASLVI